MTESKRLPEFLCDDCSEGDHEACRHEGGWMHQDTNERCSCHLTGHTLDPRRTAAWGMSIWEGAAVVRLIPLRMALNFWRIREHTEEGFRVRFYRTRRGVTILSVTAEVASDRIALGPQR